ncbi:SnoaL-like domain-containing protein [Saccharopolyspora antimicrobica]|uniref:SnoaL-like domain-containing protein n=1 Tax=Saccharopolyspora antimicrobica TaxID=455193 RepID=A0A1I5JYX6_9PSEU|nr:nuclear transport factor 2 family protein [Saccharopolyspora antimicrobica]RKT86992.1 SnoaL-like protein [Saccharopolyspora antimicrobica]SFO77536.1 SnoaL-like domain-containing protein [Saccharopolyspora antimicrobica]
MAEQSTELAELAARLRRLEDQQEIARLIASYGPLVDSGSADAVADRWEPDGAYDVDELSMNGRDEITAMVAGPRHQSWIRGGCAHFLGPAHVTVEDDDAVAVGHSLMIVHRDGEFVVRRATANRWQLRRGPQGWRVTRRTSRVLDGRAEAPRLLAALDIDQEHRSEEDR